MYYLRNDPKSIPNKVSISCVYLSNSLNLIKKTKLFFLWKSKFNKELQKKKTWPKSLLKLIKKPYRQQIKKTNLILN
jgi:hypothetical protein